MVSGSATRSLMVLLALACLLLPCAALQAQDDGGVSPDAGGAAFDDGSAGGSDVAPPADTEPDPSVDPSGDPSTDPPVDPQDDQLGDSQDDSQEDPQGDQADLPQPDAEVPGGATSAQGGATDPQSLATPAASNPKPLTREQADKLFSDMGNRAAREGFTPDFKSDGCYWRADIYEQEAKDQGSDPQRVHITIGADAHTQAQADPNNPDWQYHTAVVLPVLDDNGQTQPMVFDPAAHAGPVAVSDWSKALIAGDRLTSADAVEPFTKKESYVTVQPGSTADARNFYPPYWQEASPLTADQAAMARTKAQALAEGSYRDAYPAGPGGAPNPDRYTWRNAPPAPTRQVATTPPK